MKTKTNISAQIVADSINQQGDRLTSLLITFPRIILAEVNTHRMLSKNTSSSRAIPFKKMIEAVQNDPFIPIAWQKHHKGMQGNEYLTDRKHENAIYEWLKARDYAIKQATIMNSDGVTKQLCNRLLEPFMWTTMLITGSKEGWDNFFSLRCPSYEWELEADKDGVDRKIKCKSKKEFIKDYLSIYPTHGQKELVEDYLLVDDEDVMIPNNNIGWLQINKGQAEIHIMDLAEKIYDDLNQSTPNQLEVGEWHIPFVQNLDLIELAKLYPDADDFQKVCVKISTAMAARTSYTVVGEEKGIDYAKMIELHDRLIAQNPPHSSPMEHCARAMSDEEYYSSIKTTSYPLHIPQNKEEIERNGGFVNKELYPQHEKYGEHIDRTMYGWCRNFKGFIQYRHLIEKGGSL